MTVTLNGEASLYESTAFIFISKGYDELFIMPNTKKGIS